MTEQAFEYRGFVLPPHMQRSLDAYIRYGRPVGGFLKAVISNDLVQAAALADGVNVRQLPAFAAYLWNEAPRACWGSAEAYKEWTRINQRQEGSSDGD